MASDPQVRSWYYARNGERRGAVNESELVELARSGGVLATDHVWHSSLGEWKLARDVPSLAGVLGARPAGAPGPAAAPGHGQFPQQHYPQQAAYAPQHPYPQPHAAPYPQQGQQYPAPYPQQPGYGHAPQYAVAPYQPQGFHSAVSLQQLGPAPTTTGMKVAGFLFHFFILPGTGSFFVGRPGQAVAQILLVIFGVLISLTGVGAIIGIPMIIGGWIWGIVTVAMVPTAPSQTIVHHVQHPQPPYQH